MRAQVQVSVSVSMESANAACEAIAYARHDDLHLYTETHMNHGSMPLAARVAIMKALIPYDVQRITIYKRTQLGMRYDRVCQVIDSDQTSLNVGTKTNSVFGSRDMRSALAQYAWLGDISIC